jgi:hypothetical protein
MEMRPQAIFAASEQKPRYFLQNAVFCAVCEKQTFHSSFRVTEWQYISSVNHLPRAVQRNSQENERFLKEILRRILACGNPG